MTAREAAHAVLDRLIDKSIESARNGPVQLHLTESISTYKGRITVTLDYEPVWRKDPMP